MGAHLEALKGDYRGYRVKGLGFRDQSLGFWGTFFKGPHKKDYSMLGSILGSPYFGKLPFRFWGVGFRILDSGSTIPMAITMAITIIIGIVILLLLHNIRYSYCSCFFIITAKHDYYFQHF